MEDYFPIYLIGGERVLWPDAQWRPASGAAAVALAAAGERDIALVVPGEEVLLTQAALPPIRQTAKRRQAARYALEDRLVTPVDELHFALGKRRNDGIAPVAAVARERMTAWLETVRAHGVEPAAAVPDYLCLPAADAGSLRIWLAGGRALVRGGDRTGFACEYELLPGLLAAGPGERPRLSVTAAAGEDEQELLSRLSENGHEIETEFVDDPGTLYGRLLRGAARTPPLNLNQGEFAPASRTASNWWRPLRVTAALFAGWLILALSVQALSYWQLRQEAEALRERSVADFREAFPRVQRIRDLRVQAEEELRALRGDGAAGTLFALLQTIALAGAGDENLRIESLQYRDGALYLSLSGDNVQALETLRDGFERQSGARLTVESADAGSGGVQIRARVERTAGI